MSYKCNFQTGQCSSGSSDDQSKYINYYTEKACNTQCDSARMCYEAAVNTNCAQDPQYNCENIGSPHCTNFSVDANCGRNNQCQVVSIISYQSI